MLRLFAIINKPPSDDTFIIGKSQINVYLTVTRMTDHGRHSHDVLAMVVMIAILAAAIFVVAILATTILAMAILAMGGA